MDRKTAQAINISLIILLVIFVTVEYKWFKERMARPPQVPAVEKREKAPIKYRVVQPSIRREDLSDFEKMFADNPQQDVGGNVVEAWRNIPEEQKGEVKSRLDRDIADLELELRRDPGNKKAKRKLKVSKMVKKLIDSGFDIGDNPPAEGKEGR